eukprot:6457765-Prymnesium_polylepis.1
MVGSDASVGSGAARAPGTCRWQAGQLRVSSQNPARQRHVRSGISLVYGRWPMVAPGGGVGRYARPLRCLWHEVRVDERTVR